MTALEIYPDAIWTRVPAEDIMGLQLLHTCKSGLIFGVGEDAEQVAAAAAAHLGRRLASTER